MLKEKVKFSERTTHLKQSAIRSASARCAEMGGINLGQGVCDIPTQKEIKQAASDAIFNNKNLYAAHEGVFPLRAALMKKIQQFNQVKLNSTAEILVSHGSTGAYVSAIKTLFNPGDEIILFEPFYGYHKYIAELLGVKTASIKIDASDYAIDFALLQKTITKNTRGIVICTPCNPSGKVFSKQELITIGELAKKYNLFIITDEIYEYITYPGYEHISIASLNDYWDRTITISGFSKTYNVTGWRLGYAYGPEEIIAKMALVHDLLYVCPPTPLQHAMLAALDLPNDFYTTMQSEFLAKRDYMVNALQNLGFKLQTPQGAYYLMADFSDLGFADGETAANNFLEHAKVATVPGRSFFSNPEDGKHLIRICFALDEEKLHAAIAELTSYLNKSR